MFIGLIITVQIVSILAAVVISNVIQIISSVRIPNGYVYINFDYTQPDDMNVSIPYYINNPGISDLNDIVIKVRLYANYTHNQTKMSVLREIFYKKANLGKCRASQALNDVFEGDFIDYNISAIITFLNEVDPIELFWILADIEIHANYFLGIIQFKIFQSKIILI